MVTVRYIIYNQFKIQNKNPFYLNLTSKLYKSVVFVNRVYEKPHMMKKKKNLFPLLNTHNVENTLIYIYIKLPRIKTLAISKRRYNSSSMSLKGI